MLKIRVIPTLLWKGPGLVKGAGFDSWRRVGPVLPAIRVYNRREVDELVLLDIAATPDDEQPDLESLADYGQDCFVPLCFGGGIRDSDQVRALLRSGADKVSVNSAAYARPDLVRDIARRHGTQCVVASIDVRPAGRGRWTCFSHAGMRDTGQDAVAWARQMQDAGAGEILLTSIDRDGTFQGYDLDLIAAVSAAVSVPVIASGGAGGYGDMVAAVRAGASAVAAASIFHFTELTPAGAKAALAEAGFPVRQTYVEG
jgi:imidazole glycerol-phosphate synthase subunit HisF